jgi:WD40 repeat protein
MPKNQIPCLRPCRVAAPPSLAKLTVFVLATLGRLGFALGADEGEPLLRLEAGGPTGYVTALAFSPDSQALYAGSWDKTVRVWRWNVAAREYQLDPSAWRVPIGPGLDGAINAIAVSADGNWLAAAGRPVIRGSADFRSPGRILPTFGGMTDEMRLDEGTIHVFDTRTRVTRTLRGHRGEVRSLTFAPSDPERPLLLSAAREWDETAGKFGGSVRLWDVVAKEPYVAGPMLPEPRHETWPKLAVRRTGVEPKALDVAIAWGDGIFRTWDVAGNRLAERAGQGQFQDTVVFQESTGQFITGALADNGGTRLRSWRSANGSLEPDAARSTELGKSADAVSAPRALALASAEPGAKADLLVSVIHRHFVREPAKDQYEIWLSRIPVRGAEIRPIRLWSAGPPPRRLPVVATIPGGKHVAVTSGLEIHVYAIADLLAGRVQPQLLRSAGSSIGTVAFLEKEGAPLTLGLSERRRAAAGNAAEFKTGDVVFDMEKTELADFAGDAGWKVAAPPAKAWRVEVQKGEAAEARQRLQVMENGERRGAIDLPAGHELTDYALAASRQPPILAVASHHNGLPSLNLYNAATGQQVRQLSSHAGLVRSLAFSTDAQLLVSAADDQTVCIWRLVDLDKIVDQRGLASGIAVRKTPDGLAVEVDETTAPAATLKDGDIVLGRMVGNQLRPWETARDFYDTFWNATPGDTIQVRRSRAGALATADVTVAQGADERKPLLSLFVTRAPAAKARGWIGWSPLGPYQASGEEVEQHLGWHFNTGRPESPVAFAGAAQYREKYFRKGLLDSLIKTGLPPKVPDEAAKLPRPDLDLIVDGKDPQPLAGGIGGLVRFPPSRASLVVPDLASANIDKVELQVDDLPATPLSRQEDGRTWAAELDLAAWKPGEHRIKATLFTREAMPQSFVEERRLRFQLPAPQLTVKNAKPATAAETVDQPQFTFSATVEPSVEGEMVDIVLRRRSGKDVAAVKEWSVRERLEISEMVTLEEGGNIVELEARNHNALVGFEGFETSRERRTLNFSKAVQPGIVSATIKPLQEGEPVQTLGLEGPPAIVTIGKIELSGELKEGGGALAVESSLGGPSADVKTVPAAAGKPAKFITGEIALKPGIQTVILTRKAAAGLLIESGIQVDYRPPLPALVFDEPKADQTLIEGRDPPMLELSAKFPKAREPHPFQAAILINGKRSKVEPAIDLEESSISAKIPLELGENQVAIELTNAWNPPKLITVAKVNFVTLPSVTKFGELPDPQSPVVDVVVFGKSALPITQVDAAGAQLPKTVVRYDQGTGEWQATIRDVALQAEASEMAVHVWNEHGKSLAPGVLKLPAWRQPEPPPVVEMATGGNTTKARYEINFAVRSKSRLRSVNMQHDKVPVYYAPKLNELQANADGWFIYEAKVPVTLKPGNNRFEVLAANESGSQFDQSLINYIDPPARVVIGRVQTADLPTEQQFRVVTKGGRVQVEKAFPTGKMMVYGHVEWSKTADEALTRRLQQVQVWVNGFQQAPVVISPPGKNLTSEFSAFIVLNQEKGNQIQFALPELTSDLSTAFDIYVDCDKPVREQRLHLLVIGVGASAGSEAELETQVLTAMKARRSGREYRTSAFDRLAIYGPLVGSDITPQQVRSQLSIIKLKIDDLYRANRTSVRPANDVIMIYLQGGRLVHVDKDFFVTTRPSTDPRTARALLENDPRIFLDVAVRSRTLADFLTHTTGAHILLLDVAGSQDADAGSKWPEQSRAAMLRYTWLKDSVVPPKARLLAALPEAIQSTGKLQQIGERIENIHSRLAAEYPQSIAYNRRVPEILQSLLLGESLTKGSATP